MVKAAEHLATETDNRVDRVLAKLRNRQLQLAMEGRIEESFQYASRALRVRRLVDDDAPPTDLGLAC